MKKTMKKLKFLGICLALLLLFTAFTAIAPAVVADDHLDETEDGDCEDCDEEDDDPGDEATPTPLPYRPEIKDEYKWIEEGHESLDKWFVKWIDYLPEWI